MKVALIQMSCTPNVEFNLQKLAKGIAQAAQRGAELVVLQELHNTPYFCQTENPDLFDLAEPIPGPSTDFFGTLARQFGIVIVTSLFERRAAGLYHNTAVVIEKDGTIAGKYRKMHIPDDPAYYEKFYFTPGDLGFEPIYTSVGRLGVQVCWDQWYPEGARLMALRGADLLIYPTAIGYESSDTPEEQARSARLSNIFVDTIYNSPKRVHQNIRFGVPSFLLANFSYKLSPIIVVLSCPISKQI